MVERAFAVVDRLDARIAELATAVDEWRAHERGVREELARLRGLLDEPI